MAVADKLKFIEDYKNAQNAASGSKLDANANVTDKNIATLAAELPKADNVELQRAVMCKYLGKYAISYGTQYLNDLKSHIIYRHDETGGAGGYPYCASISLYPFLLNGLKEVGGYSEPPQHADTFVGGFLNLIYIVAAQFIGAVAAPETLTYLDHFLRKDYGDDYINHLDDVMHRIPTDERRERCREKKWQRYYKWHKKADTKAITLRDRIEQLFAQLVYTINQPAAARGNQSIFFNIAYFDEYYFNNIFNDFVFPDGDEPCWKTTSQLQKMFMKWFNAERTKTILTFPVETLNILVDKETGEYKDKDTADFAAEMWSEGASFFMYQSDSVDALASCCRLRNAVEENVFSYTLGAGGIETGSKAVITLNINRIVQDWYKKHKDKPELTLPEYLSKITKRVHIYLQAFNDKLWDDYNAGLLTIYRAGFIDLDKQFLTVGVNGFIEGAEFLKITPDPENEAYRQYAKDVLGTIEELNRKARSEHCRFNLEVVPAEGLAVKNYNWDKADGYKVNPNRDCYNSYFYPVEADIDPIKRFFYQGYGFADVCSGGVALHNNLAEHLSKEQYRYLMDIAVKAGCNYFTYNIKNTICNDCGYISKHTLDKCPHCGGTNLDYATRIVGYLKRESNFSAVRQEEAKKRAYTTIDDKVSK